MLSDEEKKEYIEHEILDRLYCLEENDFDKNKVDDGYIKAVLNACKEAKNLIEKQSKEIEELKDESKEYQIGFAQGCYEKDLDWKDKIKAKIEEIDFMIKEINQGHLQKYTVGELLGAKRFLESLLEKE